LFSADFDSSAFGSRFHGHDERIDVESLGLATDYWIGIATEVLG
jgi:di/tripeptidase